MTRKRTWFVKLRSTMTSWGCLGRVTRRPYAPGEDWARFITIHLETEDGRPLDLVLTPNEGRRLAVALEKRATWIDDTNRKQGNGWTLDQRATDAITSF